MITLPVMELNVTRHCNNSCASCNHASPLATEPYYMTPEVVLRDLTALKRVARVQFLCMQGGEPLLNPRLGEIIHACQNSGIADQLGILTNGRRFPQMDEEFWQLCAYMKIQLRCTVYPNLPAATLSYATQKAKQYQLDFRPGHLTAFLKVLGHRPQGESFRKCPWKTCFTTHEGYFYLCPLAVFWPKLFFNTDGPVDGYPILGDDLTEAGLQAYIDRKDPLLSCTRCTGADSPWMPWHQVTDREQWIKESTYDPIPTPA